MKLLSRNEEGQALVEFALVVPLLLLILCGIIDFGWMFFNQLSLQNACREGARYATVHSSSTDITTEVKDKVQENIPGSLSGLNVTVTFTDSGNPIDGDVKVKVKAKFEFLTPVLGTIYHSDSRNLADEVIMKVES